MSSMQYTEGQVLQIVIADAQNQVSGKLSPKERGKQ